MPRSLLVVILAACAWPVAAETGPQLVGPFTRETYPQAIIDRPLTLPAGMVEGEVGAEFSSVRVFTQPEVFFGTRQFDDWNVDVALRVGVTDRLQIEAGTAFSLDHTIRHVGFEGVSTGIDTRPSLTSWQRVVPVRLSLLALDTESIDTAVTLTVPFMAHSSRTIDLFREGRVRFSDGRHVVPEVDLAAPTRWRLGDRLWLRAGEDLFAVSTEDGVAECAFVLGLGLQLHPMVAVTLDSRIATLAFDGGGHESSTTVADVGTIELTGYFTPIANVDVIGALALPDVGGGFDDYLTRIAIRVRL
jgi:hypothetical protein